VKLLVYRNKTHRDQYLNFSSQHPIQHKLSVIRALLDRCSKLVAEPKDRETEETHILEALSRCGYPECSLKKVKSQLESQNVKKKKKHELVQPYIECLSEAVGRVYQRYGISTTMRPHITIRNMLFHPKDKVNLDETAECAYGNPCKNCDKVYIGETGRSFGVRMKEDLKEVEAQEGRKYTRSSRKQPQLEQNKFAITDHINQENHVINWNEAKIIARESDKTTRWIREAVKIRQESRGVMNRDEGAYQLSHV